MHVEKSHPTNLRICEHDDSILVCHTLLKWLLWWWLTDKECSKNTEYFRRKATSLKYYYGLVLCFSFTIKPAKYAKKNNPGIALAWFMIWILTKNETMKRKALGWRRRLSGREKRWKNFLSKVSKKWERDQKRWAMRKIPVYGTETASCVTFPLCYWHLPPVLFLPLKTCTFTTCNYKFLLLPFLLWLRLWSFFQGLRLSIYHTSGQRYTLILNSTCPTYSSLLLDEQFWIQDGANHFRL